MARGRAKPPKRRTGRDYAAEYRRRQAKARREGFSGYYAKRVRGGERASPSAPAPRGAALRKARGHASARDLGREAGPDWFVSTFPLERDDQGRWTRIRVDVIDDEGTEREYWLSGKALDEAEIERLARDLDETGVRFAPRYDLRRIYEERSAADEETAA